MNIKTRNLRWYSFLIVTMVWLQTFYHAGAQQMPIVVENTDYRYQVQDVDGVPLLVIDGFSPSPDGPWKIPSRIVRVRTAEFSVAPFTIGKVEYGEKRRANPFYFIQNVIQNDSTLFAEIHPVPAVRIPTVAPGVRIISQRLVKTPHYSEIEIEVPLISYDASTGETQWIERLELLPDKSPAALARSMPAVTEGEYYHQLSIMRWPNDLDTTGAWMSFSGRMIRFFVNKDGLYRITKNWFANSNVSLSGVDPRTIKLFRKGIEIPMFASGMDDGAMDDPDYFIFFGERNYPAVTHRRALTGPSSDEPYPEYLSRYSDSTAYWLVIDATPPKRMESLPLANAPNDTINWHYQNIHQETDIILNPLDLYSERKENPLWTSADTWYEGPLKEENTISRSVLVDNLKTDMPTRVWCKYISGKGDDFTLKDNHRVVLSVNSGIPFDSLTSNGNEQALAFGLAPPGSFVEGANTVKIFSRKLMPTRTEIAYDWLEVEYPRYAVAANNSLMLRIDSVMGQGMRWIEMRNFDTDGLFILKYSATGYARIDKFNAELDQKYRIVFADTLQTGTRYFAQQLQDITEPPPGAEIQTENLRSPNKEAAYVLVTTKAFLSEATQYASFIGQEYNLTTRIVLIEDIYNNYGYGIFSPEALKIFLYDAYRSWKTSPLKYVFLVGDANYEYKRLIGKSPYAENFVPSYGYPVSDTWYVCYDPQDMRPSVSIGRLPARSGLDVLAYKNKHQLLKAQKLDVWNKTTLHFSGGNGDIESDLLLYRRAHQSMIDSVIIAGPYSGNPTHFYKTVTPKTMYGPTPLDVFNQKIANSGIIISYLGHSGTETWDNSINDPKDLENTASRFPLVSDFGCSTGKYAEPDIRCFAEQFVTPDRSQAIGYLGNSSLGFTTTSLIMPAEFYSFLFRQNAPNVGRAHLAAKYSLVDKWGYTPVNRIFVLTNTLVGDPIVHIPVPEKPNLLVKTEWIRTGTEVFTNAMDTVTFHVPVGNYGKHFPDSVMLEVEDYQGSTLLTKTQKMITMPGYIDTVIVKLPGLKLHGSRSMKVRIDPGNLIDEYDETDNQTVYQYYVLNSSLSIVNSNLARTSEGLPDIKILNPLFSPGSVQKVLFEFSHTFDFASPNVITGDYGKTVTAFKGSQPLTGTGKKYWRAALDIPNKEYIGPYRYWVANRTAPFVQKDSMDFSQSDQFGIRYLNGGNTLLPGAVKIRVVSAGAVDGNFGSVERNGVSVLPFAYFNGYHFAIFDSATMKLVRTRNFWTWENASHMDSLVADLGRVGFGEIVAISTSDEPRRRSGLLPPVLHQFGSSMIDLVVSGPQNPSFAMIGRRGLAPGQAVEAYTQPFQGKAIVDTTFSAPPDSGWIVSPLIGPAASWTSVRIDAATPRNSAILYEILATDSTARDTTLVSIMNADSIDLSSINAELYPYLHLRATLIPSINGDAPSLFSWSVDYRQYPELALNYQSVSFEKDSVDQNDALSLKIGVVNAGDARSGAFPVSVEVVGDDNIPHTVATYIIQGLGKDAWHDTTVVIEARQFRGNQKTFIYLDKGDSINEQVESNNVYQTGFYVRKDTTRPNLLVMIDGVVPVDGDYVQRKPNVVLSLKSSVPITNLSTKNFRIMLDGEDIRPSDSAVLSLDIQKAELTYRPLLFAGVHTFQFNAEDAYGNLAYDEWYPVTVLVDTISAVSRIFNYPNPFKDQTAFTFLVTGESVPRQIEIKFYTVAGRMIRRVQIDGEQLRLGYNSWRWDGRDDDGDLLSNGVYFYKFISKLDNQNAEVIGKVAVLR